MSNPFTCDHCGYPIGPVDMGPVCSCDTTIVKPQILVVDSRDMTPAMWCEDFNTAVEYIKTEPEWTHGHYVIYERHGRLNEVDQYIPVASVIERRRNPFTGEEYTIEVPA
jgi:hypothetical protein